MHPLIIFRFAFACRKSQLRGRKRRFQDRIPRGWDAHSGPVQFNYNLINVLILRCVRHANGTLFSTVFRARKNTSQAFWYEIRKGSCCDGMKYRPNRSVTSAKRYVRERLFMLLCIQLSTNEAETERKTTDLIRLKKSTIWPDFVLNSAMRMRR